MTWSIEKKRTEKGSGGFDYVLSHGPAIACWA